MNSTKHRLDLRTLYITEPGLLLNHMIGLHLEGEQGHGHGHGHGQSGEMRGTITFDRNLCSLNEWGDRTVCTKMASIPRDARATLTADADPMGHGRRRWELAVDGVDDMKLHLVEYPRERLWYLVVNAGDKGSAVASLFPREAFEPAT